LGNIEIYKGLKGVHLTGKNRIITIFNLFHHLTTGLTEIGRCANDLFFKLDTSFFVSFLPFKTTPPCGFQNAPISIPFYTLMIRPIKGADKPTPDYPLSSENPPPHAKEDLTIIKTEISSKLDDKSILSGQ
jgi:hypothetical protein